MAKYRFKPLLENTQTLFLNCKDYHQTNFTVHYTKSLQPLNKPLLIPIHGWLGSSKSAYVMSASHTMLKHNYDIARINLVDHGETEHANFRLFDPAYIEDIKHGIKRLCEITGHKQIVLLGFSLGANIALRLSASETLKPYIKRTLAVCPTFNPRGTLEAIDENIIYRAYFINKIKNFLHRKISNHPVHAQRLSKALNLKTVDEIIRLLHKEFRTQRTTPHETFSSYLESYAISQEITDAISCPTQIIMSKNDPIVLFKHYTYPQSENIVFQESEYGGHCTFVTNMKLNSWLCPELVSWFVEEKQPKPAVESTSKDYIKT